MALAAVAALSACNPRAEEGDDRAAADAPASGANEQLRDDQFEAYAAQADADRRQAQADGERAMQTREKRIRDERN